VAFDGLVFKRLSEDCIIKPFNSVDDDLNEFLLDKSKFYQNELLATTYIIENEEKTVAYFSIFNDSLRIEEVEFASKGKLKKFLASFLSHPKRHLKHLPAIKIGRLAVCKEEKGKGKLIIAWILNYALDCNQYSACKLITVDAYAQSLGFYEKMGFGYITDDDKDEETRQMFLDLTPLINAEAS